MKYYLDTEFYEDGVTIDLISIAMVREDGESYYAVNRDAHLHRVSDWIRKNVLIHLPPYSHPGWKTREQIKQDLIAFIGDDSSPEFWAYYADYDWVVFCQLFGTMLDLPSYFPKFCRDLKQLAVERGNPKLSKQVAGEHHALADARWNMEVHRLLQALTIKAPQVPLTKELVEEAVKPQFGETGMEPLSAFLSCEAVEARYDKQRAKAFRTAAQIIDIALASWIHK